MEKIIPLREQAALRDGWLKKRLQTVIPEAMAEAGVDMWIVLSREHNEDPVLKALLPATAFYVVWQTMLVFSRQKDGSVECLAIGMRGLDPYYLSVWERGQETVWQALRRVVSQRDPARIAINTSRRFGLADGLTCGLYAELTDALGPRYAGRLDGSDQLPLDVLSRRSREEIEHYRSISSTLQHIIRSVFSRCFVQPGVTRYSDLVWELRQRIQDQGLNAWFQPSVFVQRQGGTPDYDFTVEPGDVLHCDVGLEYLGFMADVQEMAYILRPDETTAPSWLQQLFAQANRAQDILASQFALGLKGREIHERALKLCSEADINATIYSHPLGFHGHGAGPTIGISYLALEEVVLRDNIVFALELNIQAAVPEWGNQPVMVPIEQDVVFRNGQLEYLAGRQTQVHLI